MSRKSKVISMDLPSKLSHQLVFSSGETSLDPSLVKKIIRVIEEHERPREYIEFNEKKEDIEFDENKEFFNKYVLTKKCKNLSRDNRDKLRNIFTNIIHNDRKETIKREEIEKIVDAFYLLDCELELEEKKLQQNIIYNFMKKHQNKI